MRYAIDVIFCDRYETVVHVVRDMKPRRVTKWVPHARVAFELSSTERLVDVAVGDVLRLEEY
jgi:uncharacterized membrane protein (UPF0127 family)